MTMKLFRFILYFNNVNDNQIIGIVTKMYNVALVHVFDSLTNLSHVVDNFGFGHGITISGDLFE